MQTGYRFEKYFILKYNTVISKQQRKAAENGVLGKTEQYMTSSKQ